MSLTELEAENFRLRAMVAEIYTAMLAAGWHEEKDKLLQRVPEEAKK